MVLVATAAMGLAGAVASAGQPDASEQAMARLASTGPHRAHYTKLGSDEPAITLEYRSPQDIVIRVHSSDGEFGLSLDATHFRVQLNDDCAEIPISPMLASIDAAALSVGKLDEPWAPMVTYRLSADEMVDLQGAFHRSARGVPLSWIADLRREGEVTLTEAEAEWQARMGELRWSVSQETGALTAMSAGSIGVELASLEPLPPSAGGRAPLCTRRADSTLSEQFTGMFLMSAYAAFLPESMAAWAATPAGKARDKALARQEAFWEAYFTAEMAAWAEELASPALRAQVVAGMTDRAGFEAFAASLPEAQRGDVLHHWQQAWYTNVGQQLIQEHAGLTEQQLVAMLSQGGVQIDDPDAFHVLVLGPMRAAALRVGEGVVKAPLLAAVEAGGAALVTP